MLITHALLENPSASLACVALLCTLALLAYGKAERS